MPKAMFSLHRYDGPAQINGLDFANVHVSEHADSEGIVIHMGWEGVATTPRQATPAVTPEWMHATSQKDSIEVLLPSGGSGQAYPTEAAYVDDDGYRYWRIVFTGIGPSPWAEEA